MLHFSWIEFSADACKVRVLS